MSVPQEGEIDGVQWTINKLILLKISEDSVDPVSRIAEETPPSTLNPSILSRVVSLSVVAIPFLHLTYTVSCTLL